MKLQQASLLLISVSLLSAKLSQEKMYEQNGKPQFRYSHIQTMATLGKPESFFFNKTSKRQIYYRK